MSDLERIFAYKSVHALCTVLKKSRELKATHYACCMVGGPSPVWAVYTVGGKFVRFAASREQIAAAYPDLTWRRKMARWGFNEIEDRNPQQRRAYLKEVFHARDEA